MTRFFHCVDRWSSNHLLGLGVLPVDGAMGKSSVSSDELGSRAMNFLSLIKNSVSRRGNISP